ncbi:HlyD family efflux transporter periplasmic adaptor subunit [Rhodocytophaga aerolata]|uniref:HlyD family efflux transporter periplasmic adaptor subunit n=1 Tax=Rhodocytophaga aerolata TaxID=455078 RepID=A0ABT8RCE3_9BACT|nr:HlyD family efflux transporter periplasmic adaptor subunit [Rhodocytophaga aerolata]MDO1449366.1 HlyD family efflux transporter periplasmic adaptor subunit [Rhodocytophaga aerolata]
MKTLTFLFIGAISLWGCNRKGNQTDAYGNFEAVETIVSAQATGVLESFAVEEGQTLDAGIKVGLIDTLQLALQKEQLKASLLTVSSRTPNIATQTSFYEQQIALQEEQLKALQREKKRTENLLAAESVPGKQLDDINTQISMIEKQIALIKGQRSAQASALTTQKTGIQSETLPLQKQIERLSDQIEKSTIVNPVSGTVTMRLAEPKEVVSYGKALYKIADLNKLVLRAYISGDQLVRVKVGQQVKVLVDAPNDTFQEYEGNVQWIASKAEFTPKVIQTKEERVNLVYAMKILVKNNGSLKIGMPGEVVFN